MGYKVAVVGATGNVGREMLNILEELNFPVDQMHAIASRKSKGVEVSWGDKTLKCQDLESFDFSTVDLVLMSAGGKVSKEWSEKIGKAGPMVIDNSSAFRMDPDVPLIVPEVNPDAIKKATKKNIIANPNCSTAQLVVALKPLHDAARITRCVVSTYQSVSGAGKEGMDELWTQTKAIYGLGDARPKVFSKQIAFNVIPMIGTFLDDGYTDEEAKMWKETHKILDPDIKLTVTCVRVPVFVGHSESVTVEFERPLPADEARAILREAPGVLVIDKQEADGFITPVDSAGEHAVYISRIRKDHTVKHGLSLWVVSDNLRKGAALNAVQIAQLLDETGMIKPSSGYRSITV
jgi:aspartate-semialdehyde dehydrogenase